MQYLIDASVYVFRAYYSMPDDMVDNEGNPVNALYGFCRFLGDFIEQVNPEHVAVLFDESLTSSFRTRIYPEYKANRDPAPPELKRQFQQCRRYTRALGVMERGSPHYEADDLIGTLVEHGRVMQRPSTIVSRDKDLAQLLGRQDVFWDFAGKGKVGYEQVPEVFGVWPEQIADFLALAGDAVDNIKGVPGVGKKTATLLLQHFGGRQPQTRRLTQQDVLCYRHRFHQHEMLVNHADAEPVGDKRGPYINLLAVHNDPPAVRLQTIPECGHVPVPEDQLDHPFGLDALDHLPGDNGREETLHARQQAALLAGHPRFGLAFLAIGD